MLNTLWTFIHRLASPRYFYHYANKWLPYLSILTMVLFCYGLCGALLLAPADFKQGDGFRIIYIHVPAATLSLMIYVLMAISAAIGLIWKMKLAHVIAKVSAPIGASFTGLALISGSIWGKPMWGTWWVWDARLTSELILLFLYCAIIGIHSTIRNRKQAANASAIFLWVGLVDIPIIHFSVNWWNTLHQGASLSLWNKPKIAPSMLHPLLAMMAAFFCFYCIVMLLRARNELLSQERHSHWVATYVNE